MKRAASLNYLHKSSDASFEVSSVSGGAGTGLCVRLGAVWPVARGARGILVGPRCSAESP